MRYLEIVALLTFMAAMTAVMGASKSVYLSVVMVMRNDNYGENLLHRFNRTIASLSESASLYRLDYEIIVVEWDPPGSRPLLREALVWPKNIPRLHIITVPQHVHKEVNCRGWEYEAKNLGISQAEGSFILCMNCDVILSPRLVKFLSEKTLKDDCYYRVDRYDCIELIPESMTAVQAAKHCQDHSVRLLRSWGLEWFPAPDSPTPQIESREALKEYERRGLTTEFHGKHIKNLGELHHTASGDFMLMHSKHWQDLRGFQRDSYCSSYCDNHTDSYLVAAAAAKGLRQVYLKPPMAIFHQEHQRNRASANCSSENWMRFQAAASRMLAVQTPITTNDLHGWHLDASTCDLFNISTVPSALSASKSSKDDPNDDEFRANYLCSGKTHIRGPWKRLEAYLLVANGLASQGLKLAALQCYAGALDLVVQSSSSGGVLAGLISRVLRGEEESWKTSPSSYIADWKSLTEDRKRTLLHLMSSAALALAAEGRVSEELLLLSNQLSRS